MKTRSQLQDLIRDVLADMKSCYCGKRCSWTRDEVYPLVREIERLRAALALAQKD